MIEINAPIKLGKRLEDKELLLKRVLDASEESIDDTLSGGQCDFPPDHNLHGYLCKVYAVKALAELVFNQDIQQSKQYYYQASLAKIRMASEYHKGTRAFFSGQLHGAFDHIFSDAVHLYPVFCAIHYADEAEIVNSDAYAWFGYRMVQLFQASMMKDWSKVTMLIEKFDQEYRAKVPKETGKRERMIGFYQALCEQDTEAVEQALLKVLDPDSVKVDSKYWDVLSGDYLCTPGMWFAKLAWICGHEIEIKHPMIISELLPVEPLARYENEYDFLFDPVLDNKPLKYFSDMESVEDVERYNQILYRGPSESVMATESMRKSQNTDLTVPMFAGVAYRFEDVSQWMWEQGESKFIVKHKQKDFKATIQVYPQQTTELLESVIKNSLQGIRRALSEIHNETSIVFNGKSKDVFGIEFISQDGKDKYFQLIKGQRNNENNVLLASVLCQYSEDLNSRFYIKQVIECIKFDMSDKKEKETFWKRLKSTIYKSE